MNKTVKTDLFVVNSEIGSIFPFFSMCVCVSGMPCSTGLLSRAGFVASTDAPAVALLKRAGAIPLGVTNTSELCMWLESNNRLYGITNNPYDTTRICGGSSGGTGQMDGWADG